jgi:hypothetical protein
MSRHVANSLFEAAKEVPLFHLEDIYVTGILSEKVKKKQSFFLATKSKFRLLFKGRNTTRGSHRLQLCEEKTWGLLVQSDYIFSPPHKRRDLRNLHKAY